jgi:hypothetical protein
MARSCAVCSSERFAVNAEVCQHRQRSLVSILSVAGQPPNAGGDGNQDSARCALSHPFGERLIGALRRECLDRTLFWTTTEFGRQIPEIPLQRLEGRQVLTKRSVHGHRETARRRNDSSRSNVLDLRPHLPPTKAGKPLCEQDTRRRSGERLAPHRRSNPHVSFRAPEVTVIDGRPGCDKKRNSLTTFAFFAAASFEEVCGSFTDDL